MQSCDVQQDVVSPLVITNAKSITNKINELELQITSNCFIQTCHMKIIIETWLYLLIPDAAVQLAGCTSY